MSHQNTDIDHLINSYLNDRASKCEKQELEEWLSNSSANRELFERLKEIWSISYSDDTADKFELERERIWLAGTGNQPRLKSPIPQTSDFRYWSKVAAVLFLLFAGGLLFTQMVQQIIIVPDTIAWIEKINPAGQKSSHRLPDGTKIWLNSESSFKYPEDFSDTLRVVQLKGEAFFEVAKDLQKPFIVDVDGIRTEVLGTSFNIQAYSDEPQVKVSLLEGKVRVQNDSQDQIAVLSPGEELVVSKDYSVINKQHFKYENTFGWKEGIIFFDGADFPSFRKAIEKWYGVKVEVKGAAPDDWEIRARYQREDLKNILQDISFNKNIEFELKNKNVLIIF